MKHCNRCDKDLPVESFRERIHRGKRIRRSYCRDCERAYGAEYRERNPQRLKRYGLTREELAALGNNCHLCGVSGDERRMCVDHCHETGRVRGMLCGRCNTALGVLGDNVAGLLRAVNYLRGEPLE